ncbi:MAG: hypothetical protein ACI9C4_003115, partial [Paraglaciecola sp.]
HDKPVVTSLMAKHVDTLLAVLLAELVMLFK